MMRSLLVLMVFALAGHGGLVHAASGGHIDHHMTPDLFDKPSLQRGARLYVDYCFGCHSLKYQRYELTADGLGVPHNVVEELLIPNGQKIGALMEIAMPDDQSKNWFGASPPDLTNVARVRGVDWIYSYLKGFYVDPERPLGVNNVVFPNVGMPHALLELQGTVYWGCDMVPQTVERESIVPGVAPTVYEKRDPLVAGKAVLHEECNRLVHVEGSGLMTPEEYDQVAYDLTNFLYYVGEPKRLARYEIGIYVLLFLIVLFVFTYLLGREYQKEVH